MTTNVKLFPSGILEQKKTWVKTKEILIKDGLQLMITY